MDWRALDRGIRTGQALGTAIRERKGRKAYGEAMNPEREQVQIGAIPLPDEQVAAMQDQVEGPLQPEQMEKPVHFEAADYDAARQELVKAFEYGSIDEETLHSGMQNLAMRAFVDANRVMEMTRGAWDAGDMEGAAFGAQQMYSYFPDGVQMHGMPHPDGQSILMAEQNPEDGRPTGNGLVINREVFDALTQPLYNPDAWMNLYLGMSTKDMADLESTRASTAKSRGEEERAAEMHPYELASEGALAGQRQASAGASDARAEYYRSGGSRSSAASDAWSAKDRRGAQKDLQKYATDFHKSRSRTGSKDQRQLYRQSITPDRLTGRAWEYMDASGGSMGFQEALDRADKDLRGVGGDAAALSPVAGGGRAAGSRVSGGPGDAPTITTKADYESLPSGTDYYGPDGRLRKKP